MCKRGNSASLLQSDVVEEIAVKANISIIRLHHHSMTSGTKRSCQVTFDKIKGVHKFESEP